MRREILFALGPLNHTRPERNPSGPYVHKRCDVENLMYEVFDAEVFTSADKVRFSYLIIEPVKIVIMLQFSIKCSLRVHGSEEKSL